MSGGSSGHGDRHGDSREARADSRPALEGARVLLASHNEKKLRELRQVLAPLVPGLDPHSIRSARDLDAPEPVEDAVTFAGNALIKARALTAATGLPAIADDSGLAVDVLGGAPGIFSARWCGRHGDDEANLRLLLAQIADVPEQHRGAAFVCAAALVTPDGREVVETGRMTGRVVRAPRGAGGFGYDPIFVPDGHDVTAAELGPEAKNAISHRGRAMRALAPHVARALAT